MVLLMYDLIEYTDNYSKTFRSLQQYHRNERTSNGVGVDDSFPGNSNASFK